MPYRTLVQGVVNPLCVARGELPIIVSFGGGVDSTALLAGLCERGIVPAAVIFAAVGDFTDLHDVLGCGVADVARVGKSFRDGRQLGDEHPETYDHLVEVERWLLSKTQELWPTLTVITYEHAQGRYSSLSDNCLANGTLPSISFGRHGCSLKHKGEGLDRWVRSRWPDQQVRRMVGFDAGGRDTRRACRSTFAVGGRDPRFVWDYPLQDWGWDRAACEAACRRVFGYVPAKSSCYFCGAKKPAEILDLARRHPQLAARCVEIERQALPKLKIKTIGLSGHARKGRRRKDGTWVSRPRPGRWTDLMAEAGLLPVAGCASTTSIPQHTHSGGAPVLAPDVDVEGEGRGHVTPPEAWP